MIAKAFYRILRLLHPYYHNTEQCKICALRIRVWLMAPDWYENKEE